MFKPVLCLSCMCCPACNQPKSGRLTAALTCNLPLQFFIMQTLMMKQVLNLAGSQAMQQMMNSSLLDPSDQAK